MAVETNRSLDFAETERSGRRFTKILRRIGRKLEARHPFTSLTQFIVTLNLLGFAILLSGILYLNQFRAGLIEAKVQSLLTQGEIIAGAIAASAAIDTEKVPLDPEPALDLGPGRNLNVGPSEQVLGSLEFLINPERAAPELRRLIQPTGTRARIYDRDGTLILDSDTLYSRGQVLRYDLPPPDAQRPNPIIGVWQRIQRWFRGHDLPLYKEVGGENGKAYPEVASALTGTPVPIVRVNDKGELVVSVAVPIQRVKAVLGALLLSTRGGDIDSIVTAERWEIIRMALFAAIVTVVLAVVLSRAIAGPMRRLSAAAERVRRSIQARAEIPDYSHRSDEIGHLSGALRDMTSALYGRIDAIENFAADVAHELKNPLTSLRSAAETLPLAKTRESQEKLLAIIRHDVGRLDRLITDISDASRLDAELAREDAEPVDMSDLLETIVPAYNHVKRGRKPTVVLDIAKPPRKGKNPYVVLGHDSRLGQVVTNLLENAVSFSPKGAQVKVAARHVNGEIEIAVEDEGPGIPPENLAKVFDRFYTDRPDEESFGQNSGLGLNISKQIVVAHGGRIWAENRAGPAKGKRRRASSRGPGARLVIRLPAA